MDKMNEIVKNIMRVLVLDKNESSVKLLKQEQHTVGMSTLNLFLLYKLYMIVSGRSIVPPHNLQLNVEFCDPVQFCQYLPLKRNTHHLDNVYMFCTLRFFPLVVFLRMQGDEKVKKVLGFAQFGYGIRI